VSLDQWLLAALVGLLFGVLGGYIVRVWVSRATNSVGRPTADDEVWSSLDRHMKAINEQGTSIGSLQNEMQLVRSELRLNSTEMVDFFDKTRKSEERQRGLTRRAEAAIGDEESTELQDQQLLELMEQQQGEPPAGEQAAPMTREQYYRQHST